MWSLSIFAVAVDMIYCPQKNTVIASRCYILTYDLLNVHPKYIKTNGHCKRNYNVLHVTLRHPKSMASQKNHN